MSTFGRVRLAVLAGVCFSTLAAAKPADTSVCVAKSVERTYLAGDKNFELARATFNALGAQSGGVLVDQERAKLIQIGPGAAFIKVNVQGSACGASTAELFRTEKLCTELDCEDMINEFPNMPVGAQLKLTSCEPSTLHSIEYIWTKQSNGAWKMTTRIEVIVDQCVIE